MKKGTDVRNKPLKTEEPKEKLLIAELFANVCGRKDLCVENLTQDQIFYQMEENIDEKLQGIDKAVSKNEKKLSNELFSSPIWKITQNSSEVKKKKLINKKEVEKNRENTSTIDLSAAETMKLLDESCSDEFEFEGIESGESEIQFD